MRKLSQDQIWKFLEGQENVLTPLVEQQDRELKAARCPNCGQAGCTPHLDTKRPFVSGSPLPNFVLTCQNCEVTFDPYSKLITHAPASMIESD